MERISFQAASPLMMAEAFVQRILLHRPRTVCCIHRSRPRSRLDQPRDNCATAADLIGAIHYTRPGRLVIPASLFGRHAWESTWMMNASIDCSGRSARGLRSHLSDMEQARRHDAIGALCRQTLRCFGLTDFPPIEASTTELLMTLHSRFTAAACQP